MVRILSILSIFCFASLSIATSFAGAETLIPRSMADKGTYYLIESSQKGEIISVLVKRVGVDSVVFTRSEINCKTNQYQVIEESYDSASSLTKQPGGWTDAYEGSSKGDLLMFVCK